MQRRKMLHWAAAGIATASLQQRAWSSEGAPLRIVVGFGAGGSLDQVARLLADRLRTTLNQTVIVENKAGAGGRLAMAEIKRAAPDGRTLVLCAGGSVAIQPQIYRNLGYDVVKDFTPVARVASLDFALTVGPGAPAGDLKALIAWMKAHPGKATYATSGAGSLPHFAGLLFSQNAGLQLSHVAYRGGSHAAQDLASGVVPLMIDSPTETLELVRAGKLRILAVTGEKRTAGLPDVPTLREAGIPLTIDNFYGLYAPAHLPRAVQERLGAAVSDALQQPAMREKMAGLGLVADYGNADTLAAAQSAAYRKWEGPIKASGYVPD